MLTADKAIDALGGTGSVALLLDLPAPTVSTWRKRGIPPNRWAQLVKLAKRHGLKRLITYEALASQTIPESTKPARQAQTIA